MHQQTNDNVQLARSLNLLNELVKVQSINYPADFKDMLGTLDKLQTLYREGNMDFD